jgi:DNA-binding MarR family transcriptional regulator
LKNGNEIKVSETAYDQRIFIALRQIIHATDKYSRKLRNDFKITIPQLVCLNCIAEHSPISASEISKQIHVSKSTLVGIIDRLEEKGFITRVRNSKDRRLVFIEITRDGKAMIKKAPSLLQDKLTEKLAQLTETEQKKIANSLEKLVDMMDAENIEKAAILEIKPISTPL